MSHVEYVTRCAELSHDIMLLMPGSEYHPRAKAKKRNIDTE